MEHTSQALLDAGLDRIRQSPPTGGAVEMIVRRPVPGERDVLESVELTVSEGVAGDSWNQRSSRRTADGSPHPDMQLNIVNSRAAAILAPDAAHRAMLGDQLHLDLDLSAANLPPGTRLRIGTAVIVVTDQPHTGCAKFTERFGLDAHRWVNSPAGRELNLRGINARVEVPGTVRTGDTVTKSS